MADAFGGSRIQARPPERGVFVLDHDGKECPCVELEVIYFCLH